MSTAIAVVAAILLLAPLLGLAAAGVRLAVLGLLGVLGAIPAIDAAVALVNRGVNLGFAATLLPALELRDGVPSHLRTLVAVPTLLTSVEAVEEQIERLEIHHLASPEGDLHFALVSDWTDSATEHAEGDAALVAAAARRRRASQSALWSSAGRPALSAAASPSRLERRRRAVDRLGAQARQAARAESAAARARPTPRSSTSALGRPSRPPTSAMS